MTRGRSDRGSVLVLVPAGFLVLIILAALTVDSAVAYLGQQQLHDALSAAANDSVTAGLDNGSFYGSGKISLDPDTTGQAVCDALAAQNVSGLHDLRVWMAIDGDAVHLEGRAEVDAVFGRAIPGYGRHPVSATAGAVVVEAQPATNPPGPGSGGYTALPC